MRTGWIVMAVLAAACAPSGPAAPAADRWVPLAEWEGVQISYDPTTLGPGQDGAVTAWLALEYAEPQTFQQTAYTRHEMAVHANCRQRRVASREYLLFDGGGRQVKAGTVPFGWSSVPERGTAESAWFPALCDRVNPPDLRRP
jgi:hypothetical protein